MDKSCFYTFFRSGIACILFHDNRLDAWFGFLGLNKTNNLFNITYIKVNNIQLNKYNVVDNILELYVSDNSILKNLWWIGFSTNPYSKEKTLNNLKELADKIGTIQTTKEEELEFLF